MLPLRNLLSQRFVVSLSVLILVNILYAFLVAFNPLVIYVSVVGLLLFAVWLVLDGGSRATGAAAATRMHQAVLAVILLGAFALRGVGANWGFPILGDPDEYVITDPAVAMIEKKSIDPGRYNRPNHLSIYGGAIVYPVVNTVFLGGPVQDSFRANRLPFYLTSRLMVAAWGTTATAAAYMIGSLIAPAAGLLAAALVAVFEPFVEYSHSVAPDVSLTALLMLVIYFCVKYTRSGSSRDLYLAVVFTCLSVLEKYPGLLALPLVLAVVLRASDRGYATPPKRATTLRRLAQAGALAAGALFLAAGIYGFLNPDLSPSFRAFIAETLHHPIPPNFTPRVRTLSRLFVIAGLFLWLAVFLLRLIPDAKIGKVLAVVAGLPVLVFLVSPFLFVHFSGPLSGLSGELKSVHEGHDNLGFRGNLVFYALDYVASAGYAALAFMVVGAVFVARERRDLLPVFFGFFFWVCMSALSLHWRRWALPMYISPLLLTALGVYRSYVFGRSRLGKGGTVIALAAICVIPFAGMFLSGFAATYQLLLKDTRAVSGVWCAENGITPKNTLSDGYSPFMPSKAKWIVYSDESDARYLIVSSGIYHRFFAEPARYRERVDLYNRIFALPLVKSFAPMERPDAVLWELENAAAQLRYLKRIAAAGDLAYSGPKISVYENRPR